MSINGYTYIDTTWFQLQTTLYVQGYVWQILRSRSYPSVPLPTSPESLKLRCRWFRNLCKPIDTLPGSNRSYPYNIIQSHQWERKLIFSTAFWMGYVSSHEGMQIVIIIISFSCRVSWCFMYLRWWWSCFFSCSQYFYESITLEFIGMGGFVSKLFRSRKEILCLSLSVSQLEKEIQSTIE